MLPQGTVTIEHLAICSDQTFKANWFFRQKHLHLFNGDLLFPKPGQAIDIEPKIAAVVVVVGTVVNIHPGGDVSATDGTFPDNVTCVPWYSLFQFLFHFDSPFVSAWITPQPCW